MNPSHPVFLRALARAAELGSKAETISGVAKFLKAHPAKPWTLFRPLREKAVFDRTWYMIGRIQNWHQERAERQSNPEFKRSLDDSTFGLAFARARLREIRKEYRTILAGNPDSAATFIESLSQRLEAINQIRKAHGKRPVRFASRLLKVSFTAEIAEARGLKLCKRGLDWDIEATYKSDYFLHQDGQTEWKNGRAVSYTRAVNTNYVRSFAGIRSCQEIVYFFSQDVKTVTLPSGYHWDTDSNGLKAVQSDSIKDDYHPLADILLEENAEERIVSQIHANRQLRLEAAVREAAALAEMEGVFVGIADSRRAGNCDAGTLSFAKRHALDPKRHYPAPELVGLANGDAGRVRLAISAAVRRHHQDLARGYSTLEEL